MFLLSVLGSLEEKTYKIHNRALNESPLETEVIKVSIDDKTYCLPKKDLALDIEKYPLESEVTHVIEIPKEPKCFGKLKSKILCCACPPCCCSCCPEKNKPTIKTYIVRNDDLTKLNDFNLAHKLLFKLNSTEVEVMFFYIFTSNLLYLDKHKKRRERHFT